MSSTDSAKSQEVTQLFRFYMPHGWFVCSVVISVVLGLHSQLAAPNSQPIFQAKIGCPGTWHGFMHGHGEFHMEHVGRWDGRRVTTEASKMKELGEHQTSWTHKDAHTSTVPKPEPCLCVVACCCYYTKAQMRKTCLCVCTVYVYIIYLYIIYICIDIFAHIHTCTRVHP